MLPEVVVPLIRGFRETGGTWQVQALGDSTDNHVAMKVLYMRLFKLATKDASAVVASNMTLFEGEHNLRSGFLVNGLGVPFPSITCFLFRCSLLC